MSGKKNVLITGCSSGFGYQVALAFARRGWNVYASMRNLTKQYDLIKAVDAENLKIHMVKIDVTDENSIKDAVEEIVLEANHIDVLVNNAGFGLIGALEDVDMDQVRAQFETNFYGSLRMMRALLPVFRKQCSGHIINVTSVAGIVGMPLYGLYCASKYALEGLGEALRFETRPYNIKISHIEPGPYSTNFPSSSIVYGKRTYTQESPYIKINDYFAKRGKNTHFHNPIEVANLIVKVAEQKNPKFWNPIGARVRPLFLVKRYLGVETAQNIMTFLMKVPVR